MKVRNSKEQQREKLARDKERFLSEGGKIQRISAGHTGADAASGKGHETVLFNGPRQSRRTDLTQLAATIDTRRKRSVRRNPPSPSRRPRRKLIYDDFGEPLRWVWEND